MTHQEYEAEYLQGIDQFNAHNFFEAHELWEDIWKRASGAPRLFYKGLIHAAVTLHHFGNRNLHGARKMLASCIGYLEPYAPQYMGLDVARFLEQLGTCCARLEDRASARETLQLDPKRIPKIRLVPPADSAVTED